MEKTETDKKQESQILNSIGKMKKQGAVEKAIELCLGALLNNPNNANMHILLGDLYLEKHLDITQAQNFIDEALNEYQLALEIDINNLDIYYKLGCAFYYKGEFEKALTNFKTVLAKNSSHWASYYMISLIYVRQNNLYEALNYAKLAVKENKFASSAHFLIYSILKVMPNSTYKAKIESINELLWASITLPFDSIAQKNALKKIEYMKFLPTIILAMIKVQKGDFEGTIKLYREAIDKAPRFSSLYCLLGYVYRMTGRFEDAICEYKMAIWLDNLNISAYEELCKLYEEQGDYDNAILIYLKLIELQPQKAEYQSNLGNILYLKGDLQGAIARYQNAITLNPNPLWTSVIAQTLGYVFQESQTNKDAAVLAYQSAFLLTPKDIEIYINLGSAFYDKGEYENSLLVYKKALDLEPKNAKIHCNIAYLYWGMGKIDEALKEYELAIKYDPAYDIAYNNLGVIYLDDLGRVQKAIELFKKAITFNPNYALAHYNLARSVALSGNKIEAAKLYQISKDVNTITNELDPLDIEERLKELFD